MVDMTQVIILGILAQVLLLLGTAFIAYGFGVERTKAKCLKLLRLQRDRYADKRSPEAQAIDWARENIDHTIR